MSQGDEQEALARGDARTPEYLALNPSALWPSDVRAQADTMRWLFFCSCHVDPWFTTLVVERFIKARRSLPADETRVAYATECLARFVPVNAQQLGAHELVAGGFGLADIALGCTLELAPTLGHDLSPFAHVRAWLERCQSRPSWSTGLKAG